LDSGEITARISFYTFLKNDSFKAARADQMVLVGSFLYVCLQDSDASFFPDAAGKIGVINISTNVVDQVIELQGRNPVDIVYSASENKFYVAHQAPFVNSLGNFDTSTAFGGIEVVPLGNPASSTLIADNNLGGYVEKLVLNEGLLLVIVSQLDAATFVFTSNILVMDETGISAADMSTLIEGSSDAREIAVDSQGRVWVAWRDITSDAGSATDPQVELYELDTGVSTGESMDPTVPVSSIVFAN